MLSQLSPSRLAELCSGHWHYDGALPASFSSAQIDSRLMREEELFIALKGEQVDGHHFVGRLDPALGQAAIVDHLAPDATAAQLCVADPLQALQSISREVSGLTGAVKFAVTGSVGKTGTKDMLCRMLSGFGRTHATKGNYNNHIGAPLTLAQMPEDTQFMVCELGMNHAGEIADLAQIVQPSVAAITCIADSHIGHFTSLDQIAEAKAELFTGLGAGGIAVLPRDDAFYPRLAAAATAAGARRILSFGTHADSSLRLTGCQKDDDGLVITIEHPDPKNEAQNKSFSFRLGMTARHWAMNALCGLAMCHAAGLDAKTAAAQLADVKDLPGRGKSHHLSISGQSLRLIDDSYNAGPASMKAALDNLAETPGKRAAVLSDMLELGPAGPQAHIQLADQISTSGISQLIAIGPMMTAMTAHLPDSITYICYQTSTEALAALDTRLPAFAAEADCLLVKGSHGSGAHLISQHLIKAYADEQTQQEISHAS